MTGTAWKSTVPINDRVWTTVACRRRGLIGASRGSLFLRHSRPPRQHHTDQQQELWVGDSIIATAILDRLLHHSTTIYRHGSRLALCRINRERIAAESKRISLTFARLLAIDLTALPLPYALSRCLNLRSGGQSDVKAAVTKHADRTMHDTWLRTRLLCVPGRPPSANRPSPATCERQSPFLPCRRQPRRRSCC